MQRWMTAAVLAAAVAVGLAVTSAPVHADDCYTKYNQDADEAAATRLFDHQVNAYAYEHAYIGPQAYLDQSWIIDWSYSNRMNQITDELLACTA